MNKSQFNGSILTGIIGDILGSHHEGMEYVTYDVKYDKMKEELKETMESDKIINVMTKVITFKDGINNYTDDSEMTLNGIKSIIKKQGTDPRNITLSYANNMSPNRRYGSSSKSILTKIRDEPEKWDTAYKNFHKIGSFANGALMRIAPVGLMYLFHRDDIKLLEDIKNVILCTHMHPESFEACYCFCKLMVVILCIDNLNKYDEIIGFCRECIGIVSMTDNNRLNRLLDRIKDKLDESQNFDIFELVDFSKELTEITYPLRISNTFAIVLWCFLYHFKYSNTWHPFDILKHCIFMGGDTDTNASILGNLIGLLYGDEWVDECAEHIEDYEEIKKIINSFYDVCLTMV